MTFRLNDNIEKEGFLIILRYGGSVWIRVLGLFLFDLILGLSAFYLDHDLGIFKLILVRIVFVLFLLLSVYISTDLLLTKNVVIYKDRAIKNYHLLGTIVCFLEDSKVAYYSQIFGRRLTIAPSNSSRYNGFLGIFRNIITFDCGLARREDTQALGEILKSLGLTKKTS